MSTLVHDPLAIYVRAYDECVNRAVPTVPPNSRQANNKQLRC